MKILSLEEVKRIELNLLIQFDVLCQQNELYYTLCGGTLLGAVRHKGFIPWDDDIDVLMPRPDFNRLLSEINIKTKCLPEYVRIVSWKNGQFNLPYIKLVDTRTKINIPYFNDKYKADNLWIDIFPIDGNPVDERKLKRLYKKSKFYRKLVCLKTAQIGAGKTPFRRMIKPVLIKLVSCLESNWLCQKIDTVSQTYSFEKSELIGGVLWGYGPQERIEKKAYLEPVSIEFEGHFFNAPSNYHEYLTGLYKDYMQLPPENQRITHEMTAYMLDEKRN